MNLDSLLPNLGEWLRGTGPESDVVVSTRIRLARNLADFPFTNRATNPQKAEIVGAREGSHRQGRPAVSSSNTSTSRTCSALDRQFLVERQLISRELAPSSTARAASRSIPTNPSASW